MGWGGWGGVEGGRQGDSDRGRGNRDRVGAEEIGGEGGRGGKGENGTREEERKGFLCWKMRLLRSDLLQRASPPCVSAAALLVIVRVCHGCCASSCVSAGSMQQCELLA